MFLVEPAIHTHFLSNTAMRLKIDGSIFFPVFFQSASDFLFSQIAFYLFPYIHYIRFFALSLAYVNRR